MSDEPKNKPNFRIAKAGLEAAQVATEAYELEGMTSVVVIVTMNDGDGQRNISSLSTLEATDHLTAMIEATQQFADGIGMPLEMLFLNQNQAGGQG